MGVWGRSLVWKSLSVSCTCSMTIQPTICGVHSLRFCLEPLAHLDALECSKKVLGINSAASFIRLT